MTFKVIITTSSVTGSCTRQTYFDPSNHPYRLPLIICVLYVFKCKMISCKCFVLIFHNFLDIVCTQFQFLVHGVCLMDTCKTKKNLKAPMGLWGQTPKNPSLENIVVVNSSACWTKRVLGIYYFLFAHLDCR